ncbi:hypothetical protein [Gordonia alkanivorans]|uniref:hypothetical protein n=1 Tax=Gordonia alkanivorans TaxID=84096 RepID=UPI0004B1659A|nr:hypothetical protein [Gordonia alkanivorans]
MTITPDDLDEETTTRTSRRHLVTIQVEMSVTDTYDDDLTWDEVTAEATKRAEEALSLRFAPGVEIDATVVTGVEAAGL